MPVLSYVIIKQHGLVLQSKAEQILTKGCASERFVLSSSRLSQILKDLIEEKNKLGRDLKVI
jgi:hypothetical protein